jgi:hypothetical protein
MAVAELGMPSEDDFVEIKASVQKRTISMAEGTMEKL